MELTVTASLLSLIIVGITVIGILLLDMLQSRRDHCKKKSRKWRYLNNVLKKHKRKCSRQTKDFQHKLSRRIVENTKANTIIVGDLNVKGMAQSSKATNGFESFYSK